jgi:hypothetical protein
MRASVMGWPFALIPETRAAASSSFFNIRQSSTRSPAAASSVTVILTKPFNISAPGERVTLSA